ncbi:MAG: DNA-directed RNA polymerase subunit alpha [Flavobacteriales bacterium AspAUS03]
MEIINFIKPERAVMLDSTDDMGLFQVKPLEPGFGVTLGNALRRVILSSLEGFAITSIKIEGVEHEFSTIKGVVEDVTEIVLNFKKIRFKRQIEDTEKETITADVTDREQVTSGDLGKFSSAFQVLNPDLVICNKDKSVPLQITFTIERGRGYVPAEENKKEDALMGTIAIDAIYTPIKNVRYTIENCRVGQKTDFESLLLEIKTDGSIHPKEALIEASKILIQHFVFFSDERIAISSGETERNEKYNEGFLRMRQILKTKLADMEGLSRRTLNCLQSAEIETWSDLVSYDKNAMLKVRNFGRKSLDELEVEMNNVGIYFGMDLSQYNLEKK